MESHFKCLKLSFCLFVLPGYFVDSQKDSWTFTIPESLDASIYSTVEIPCTIVAPNDPGKFVLIWYIYKIKVHQQIYNSDDPEKVILQYKNLTFLKGCLDSPICSDWSFAFPTTIKALSGSCVEIPCTLTYPPNVQDFNLLWFLRTPTGDIEVYNNKSRGSIDSKYIGRTALVQMRRSSCSLRINDVQKGGQYYPGINQIIHAYNLDGKFCTVNVSEFPPKPVITGVENMKESEAVTITCSVNHTCASRPPLLQWNIPNNQIIVHHVNLSRGNWNMTSEMLYFPSSNNDYSSLECKAIFPNGPTSVQNVSLLVDAESPNMVVTIIVLAGIGCLLLLLLLIIMYRSGKSSRKSVPNQRRFGAYFQGLLFCDHVCMFLDFYFSRNKICPTPVINEVGQTPDLTYANLDKKEVANDYDRIQVGQTPDLTYANLDKKEVANDYDRIQVRQTPDLTYANLDKKEVANDYDRLQVDNKAKSTTGNKKEAPEYENVQKT
ncbi:uncharacterized protein LOC142662690 [Rhinoderma darwinii]|uniref:uncharacterized protein LOC142662690 n=1 Tax=Rhinoderma darwinii TaxID=43563 RepID=UPI003F6703CE